jgi:hypothetical protein
MKKIKRLFIVQFLLLFIIPIAYAAISITLLEQGIYNLGDKLAPDVSIKLDQDYDGFFNMHIFCDDYELQYYTIPLSLDANFRTQVTVPELTLAGSMVDQCRLKSNFEATDGENVDSAESEYFFVADELNITIDGSLEAKPGEEIIISGNVKKYSNEFLQKGEAKISFRGKEKIVDVVSGRFEHTINLEANTEAGKIPIFVVVTDRYGNYGDKISNLEVIPIPTRIGNKFENNVLMPGDTLKARVILYDHNDRAINGSKVHVKILDPSGELVGEKDIQSMNHFEFKTKEIQIPGSYSLLITFENIKEQSSFEVEIVSKIVMDQEGSLVYVENVGNVNYNDEIIIVLESDEKKYLINKKIKLGPGEKITIDLSKEVPRGIYDIVLPEDSADAIAEEADDESSAETFWPVNVIKDVLIDDNRNVLKKTAESMSAVSGAVVGAAGYVASRPTLAAIALVLIILGTVIRYSWGFIKNTVKGKKEDDSEHLFEDFKFDEGEDNENNRPGN